MDESEQSSLFREWHRKHRGIILRIARANAFLISDQEDLIRRFDPINRSIMLLHLDGQSYLEIAEILGISEKNVGVNSSGSAVNGRRPGRQTVPTRSREIFGSCLPI